MAEDVDRESDPLQDRAQVRIFTLADYVAEEASGKLYISGAGLEWTGIAARSASSDGGWLISFYLVVRLAFPRAIARESHAVSVLALDRDGALAGPDALLQASMRFDLKRAPRDFAEVSGTLPVQVVDYPTHIEPNDVLFLHLMVDDVLVSRLPVALQPVNA